MLLVSMEYYYKDSRCQGAVCKEAVVRPTVSCFDPADPFSGGPGQF